jgi:hypothetical protein
MPEEVWRIGMAGKLEGDVKVNIQARATPRLEAEDSGSRQTVEMVIWLTFPKDCPTDVEKWFTDTVEKYLGWDLSTTVKRTVAEYKNG